jgi:hypothetical protein
VWRYLRLFSHRRLPLQVRSCIYLICACSHTVACRSRPCARYTHHSSIVWNKQQSGYSQPKIELYGVFRALRASRRLLVCTKFTLEVDASYIKGMLENLDIMPNATTTCWVAGINMLDYSMRHVPAKRHQGPDGLLRCQHNPDTDVDKLKDEDPEDWID